MLARRCLLQAVSLHKLLGKVIPDLWCFVRTRSGPVCMTESLRGRHTLNFDASDYASDSDGEEGMSISELEAMAMAM